jgi:hypothetical protein
MMRRRCAGDKHYDRIWGVAAGWAADGQVEAMGADGDHGALRGWKLVHCRCKSMADEIIKEEHH